jgi:serine/threonine protein kinase
MINPMVQSADKWSADGWALVNEAVEGVEQSWRVARKADLAQFAPPIGHPLRERVLVELIKVDQEYQWSADTQRLTETYLTDWPELDGKPHVLRELLEAECLTRAGLGKPPTAAEIDSRFPGILDQIDLERIAAEASDERGIDADRSLKVDQLFGHNGRYRILDPPKYGGMGAVYRACDRRINRNVALKVPRADAVADPAARERFKREARAAAGIQHRNICTVYDTDEADGTLYMTMAMIEGQSLADWAEGRRPDPREVARLAVKLCGALAAAHRQGIVHRDIKPSNIMIDHAGEPVLLDFGLARLMQDKPLDAVLSERSHLAPEEAAGAVGDWTSGDGTTGDGRRLTRPGSPLGTIPYMSPEQTRGEEVDARGDIYSLGVVLYQMLTGRVPGDIYSLGVVLYQMLTGRVPFKGSAAEVIEQIRHSPPPGPRSLRPDLDPRLETICLKALAKQPADRYQSAEELAEALGHYLQLPSPAQRRRRRAIASAAAAAAVVFLLTAIIYIVTDNGSVTIEVYEPGAKVAMKGTGHNGQATPVELKERELIGKIAGRGAAVSVWSGEIVVRAGDYDVEVTKEGLQRSPLKQKITVRRGEKRLVSVSFDSPGSPAASAPKVLVEDSFEGDQVDAKLWRWGEMPYRSRPGYGKTTHKVLEQGGSLLLAAGAEHASGWSVGEQVWLDSQFDLRGDDDMTIEAELSAEGGGSGSVEMRLSDGSAPTEQGDPSSVVLFAARSEKFRPLDMKRQRVRVEIRGAARVATVVTRDGVLPGFAAVDLSRLRQWKLRFLVSAGSSAGLPPAAVEARLHRVAIARSPAKSGILGRVVNEITNREVPAAVVEVTGQTTPIRVATWADGTFWLPLHSGDYTLHVQGDDLVRSGPTAVPLKDNDQAVVDLKVKKKRLGYGDAIFSLPLRGTRRLNSIAVKGEDVYCTGADTSEPFALYRLPLDGSAATRIADLPYKEPQGGIGIGLAVADEGFFALATWPGRLYRLSPAGRATLLCPLGITWPGGLAYDGQSVWFVENDGMNRRYGVYRFDPRTGKPTAHWPSDDSYISGIAWGNRRLWVSSLSNPGQVHEVNAEEPSRKGPLESRIVRSFPGHYEKLSFDQGYLWGLDLQARRICKIDVGRPGKAAP